MDQSKELAHKHGGISNQSTVRSKVISILCYLGPFRTGDDVTRTEPTLEDDSKE